MGHIFSQSSSQNTLFFHFTAVFSVVEGPKGVPVAKDAVFIRASNLVTAFSTTSESELLACGLTEDELNDLEIKSTVVTVTKTHPKMGHTKTPSWH